MKRQLCHILVMLLAVTLLPAATSCRSKKDNIIYYKSEILNSTVMTTRHSTPS